MWDADDETIGRVHGPNVAQAFGLTPVGPAEIQIAIAVGHQTFAMTLRYAHLSPDRLRDAVAALDVPAEVARTLLTCYALSAALHLATISLSTLLPLHVVELGGTKTQVGLLFSVMTVVSMVVRPSVGGWIDRYGARPVILPGAAVLVGTSFAFHAVGTPTALIGLMAGLGLSSGLISTPASVLTAQAAPPEHRD